MAQMSPHFSIAEYWSYAVNEQGELGGPFAPQPRYLDSAALDGRYLYAFGESLSTPSGWVLTELYHVEVPAVSVAPMLRPAISSPDPDGVPAWGELVPSIQLPQAVDGGVENRKYFFVLTRFPLRPETIAALAQKKPAILPTVELLPAGPHFRYLVSGPTGQLEYTTAAAADGVRVLLVADPYTIGRHLADSLEHACNRVLKYTLPDAADTPQERVEAERRTRLAVLAHQIAALREAGVDANSRLRTGPRGGLLLDETLEDLDPNGQGELGQRRRQRERYARAILAWTSSDLWERLHEDASHTPDRAQQYYAEHLRASARCLERLPETEVGEAFLMRLYEINLPPRGSRPAPTSSNEFVVQEFLFTEERLASSWQEPVAIQVGRGLFTLHLQTAKVMAAYAMRWLDDWFQLRMATGMQTWASVPWESAAGWTAYRWAYYLRNTVDLDEVVVNGKPRMVAWVDVGGRTTLRVLELELDWDAGEWQSRLQANTPNFALLGTSLNLLGVVFSSLAFAEALEGRRDPALPVLRASAAYASLATDPWVMALFSRLNGVRGGETGLRAARWLGVGGALLGAVASGYAAVIAWDDDGEGDVALAEGTATVGGLLVAWAGLAPLAGLSGPPGWIVIGGFGLMVLGSLAAAWLVDTPIENMIEHSYFGTKQGQPHNAPAVALCTGRSFSAWAGDTPEVLDRQIRALENFTWGFLVQGQDILTEDPNGIGYPVVRLTPQRLTTRSYFEVEAELWWGTRSQRLQARAHGMLRLHVGDRSAVRAEPISGDPFELVALPFQGSNVAVLSRGVLQGRHTVVWVIAPAAALRSQLTGLHLTSARLAIRLHTVGDAPFNFDGQQGDQLLVPAPEPGMSFMFLDYSLVRAPANPQPVFGALNQDPVSSIDVYP